VKLAPKKGNPFKVPKVEKIASTATAIPLAPGEKKKRGRPKGSKNRPRDEVRAEREAKAEARRAKRQAKRKLKR
jgi:hypothetical protein